MALVDTVRTALRITGSSFDDEITNLIDAAKEDLGIAGVTVSETDALTVRAIIMYSRAYFDLSNPDMPKYEAAYRRVKITMSASSELGGA